MLMLTEPGSRSFTEVGGAELSSMTSRLGNVAEVQELSQDAKPSEFSWHVIMETCPAFIECKS